jgi:hypothetical protein
MPISKTCKQCGTTFEVENQDGLLEHFYFKRTKSGEYFRNVCKTCEKQEHAMKFKSGKYNYSPGAKDKSASQQVKFGFL